MSKTRCAFLGAGIVVVALIAWMLAPGRSRSLAATPDGGAAIPVDTAVATRETVPVYLRGIGTAQAFYTVKVTARVDGELEKVDFTEGQHVSRGQLLAQIDPRPFQAALDLAVATRAKDRAQLLNDEVDLKRYVILAPQNLASKQQLDTQRATVAQAQAQIEADDASIEAARTQLDYTRITSPINAITGIRMVDPGNIVHSTDTTGIVVLTQMQPIAVIFTLPEGDLAAVTGAMARGPVEVTALSQEGNRRLDVGKLAVIDNQIDTTTGTMRLKATFPNPHDTLWPGEFVNVRVLAAQEHGVITLTSAAIQTGLDGPFTYVVKPDSTVEVRLLKLGVQSGQLTVVTSGLAAGERVVTSNQFRLQPGARVSIS
ncbi:MAG: efflux RND transporter periplasmic adaptor subunit [Steroidobacteraceae bacterium]